MSVLKNIVNGPGKSDLQTAFFNPQLNLELSFLSHFRANPQNSKIRINIKTHLKILKLELEDGSGNKFNFWGRNSNTGQDYKGHYCTKTRKGFMKAIKAKKFNILDKM